MYSEWASLHYEIQASAGNQSVLKNFSNVISKDIASNVIQSLTKTLGQGVVSGDASQLKTTNDVNWTMEVNKAVNESLLVKYQINSKLKLQY